MYYKVSPILIVIVTIVVIAMAGLGIGLVLKQGNNNKNDTVVQGADILPVLDLSIDTEEENQESVTITAIATTDDENGIDSITSPDGSVSRSDKTTYQVTKNGNYTFKVKGNNGQTSSLTIAVNNIREASATSPYLPEGFTHAGGDVESGYVIEDSYGNQFVWVPVPSGKLIRNTMSDGDYEESDTATSALVNSVAQNYGFYIARFEASSYEINGETVAASIGKQTPWTNITYAEAFNAASRAGSAFGYDGYQTSLINSYAWDTVIDWIDQSFENYSSNTNYGNYSGTVKETGTTESDIKNNICDIAGNVREWTTEIYKMKQQETNTSSENENVANEEISEKKAGYRVVRGGSANLNRTASSHTGYRENISDSYWGFRIVLYK